MVLLVGTAVFLLFTLGLGSGARLDVPFTYDGDGLEYNLLTKTMIETGWWLENPMTGAPGRLEMYDYPIGSNLDLLVMKILSLFSQNYAVVLNVYYILGFFLTGLCSLYAFRELRISYPFAVFGSLLFAFQYYHFNRIGHYNLTAYYMIPLMILVILWVCKREPLFTGRTGGGFRLTLTNRGILALFFLLVTSTHSYYGFFGLLLLAVATLWSFSRSYTLTDLAGGIIAVTALTLFMVINRIPSLIYGMMHGSSFVMSYRYAYEAEIWGMKLIQLLLPAPGHRLAALAEIAQKYTEYRPLVNENVSASLGIIAGTGLLILLAWVFIRGWEPLKIRLSDQGGTMDHLSLLTISAILIGTIGGISAIIAQFFPDIHSYNRISLYIAFFALTAILILIQALTLRYQARPGFMPVCMGVLLIILTLGILDQVPSGFALTPGSDRETEYLLQDEYFNQVEAMMAPGSSVFILPDIGGFPHSNPPGTIKGLDSMKPYLHTHAIRWSYPTMKGRFWDNWQVAVIASEPVDLLGHIFATGFTGLLIDGHGYADGGSMIVDQYRNLTGVTPVISSDNRYAFFDLTRLMEEKKKAITGTQYENEKEQYIMSMMARPELQDPLFGVDIRDQLQG